MGAMLRDEDDPVETVMALTGCEVRYDNVRCIKRVSYHNLSLRFAILNALIFDCKKKM